MAYWGTIKILNSTAHIAKNILNLSVWSIWGNPESEELKIAKENKIKLEKIEKQLQQFWAIQSGMAGISKNNLLPISLSEHEKKFFEPMILVDDGGDEIFIDKNELIDPVNNMIFHKPPENYLETTKILPHFYIQEATTMTSTMTSTSPQ